MWKTNLREIGSEPNNIDMIYKKFSKYLSNNLTKIKKMSVIEKKK